MKNSMNGELEALKVRMQDSDTWERRSREILPRYTAMKKRFDKEVKDLEAELACDKVSVYCTPRMFVLIYLKSGSKWIIECRENEKRI